MPTAIKDHSISLNAGFLYCLYWNDVSLGVDRHKSSEQLSMNYCEKEYMLDE